MIKILATTDMSANSRAGMKYAIQLARQMKAKLTFIHVHTVLRASSWSEATYRYYIDEEKAVLEKDLQRFISSVYKSMKLEDKGYTFCVLHTFDTADSIMKYAERNDFNYICISARGAGTLVKLFGTVTGTLISSSKVPVIVVPKKYRWKPLTKVLYASDLTRYEEELKEVISFARPFKAAVEMLHLSYPFEVLADENLLQRSLKKKFRYPVELHYEKRDLEETILEDLGHAVKKSKPSLVAMFTQQRQSFFDRVFIGSTSKDYSFRAQVPLLIIPKKV